MQITRRQFLTTAAAAAACMRVSSFAQNAVHSGRSLKITAIDAIAVDVPEEAEAGSLWLFVKLLTNKKALPAF